MQGEDGKSGGWGDEEGGWSKCRGRKKDALREEGSLGKRKKGREVMR